MGGGAVCVCVCMQYIHDVFACHVYVYLCVYVCMQEEGVDALLTENFFYFFIFIVCMQEEGVDALGLVVRGIFTAGIFPPILF